MNILTAKHFMFQPASGSTTRHILTLRSSQPGYITLMAVILLGAIGSATVVSVLLLGLNSSRSSFALEQSVQARSYVNSCGEYALEKIAENTNYTGSNTLTFPNGSCSYLVQTSGGSVRTISASSTVGNTVRKISLTTGSLSPTILLTSWQEVSD